MLFYIRKLSKKNCPGNIIKLPLFFYYYCYYYYYYYFKNNIYYLLLANHYDYFIIVLLFKNMYYVSAIIIVSYIWHVLCTSPWMKKLPLAAYYGHYVHFPGQRLPHIARAISGNPCQKKRSCDCCG